MFNLSKHSQRALDLQEKYLRDNNLGPTGNDGDQIHEKTLPHRSDPLYSVTEKQMGGGKSHTGQSDERIIEAILNDSEGLHRTDATWLSMPPLNVLVEKLRARRRDDWSTEKQPHWSQTLNEDDQRGALPGWPDVSLQHNKPVLPNSPDRFDGINSLPDSPDRAVNERQLKRRPAAVPLVGDITTADIDRVVHSIKTGASVDYDTAIVGILREASNEKRELTDVERQAIVNLKKARTDHLMQHAIDS